MAVSYASAKPYFYGTGRRKSSVARVRIVPGTGAITINKRSIDEYFGLETLKLIVNQPFAVTGTEGKFDIICTVRAAVSPVRQALSATASPVHFFRLMRPIVLSSREQVCSPVTLV